jgi:threonine/homoserine/homoserine lactone efflux protein
MTNPKVLVFYLAVLPQFLTADAGTPVLLAFAISHAVLSLLVLTAFLHRARQVLTRRGGTAGRQVSASAASASAYIGNRWARPVIQSTRAVL